MEKVKKVVYRGKEILTIDYTDCKEEEMMNLITKAKEFILAETKNVLIYSVFNSKNFVTPRYMLHLEKALKDVEPLIQKNALIGLSKTQLWILKGVNIWYKKKIYHFDSQEKAFEFLVGGE